MLTGLCCWFVFLVIHFCGVWICSNECQFICMVWSFCPLLLQEKIRTKTDKTVKNVFCPTMTKKYLFSLGEYAQICKQRTRKCLTNLSKWVSMFISVMLSPRGQSGLEAKILASASALASKLWPRPRPRPQPRGFGLGPASMSLSYYVIGHFLCKIGEFC